MALFRRHHDAGTPEVRPAHPFDHTVDGLEAWATAQGWQPAPADTPFGNHLENDVHEVTRVMYGVPRGVMSSASVIGNTDFGDAFRGPSSGHTVIVANGFTYIQAATTSLKGMTCTVSIVAVELPTLFPIMNVQPRSFPLRGKILDAPTGDAVFDEKFLVACAPFMKVTDVLTPDVRGRISTRDDWFFVGGEYMLGCITKGKFTSVDDVRARIDAVTGLVAAIPSTVMPASVDQSVDDLVARIDKINTVEDALAFLESLTPDDRERLAKSDTPLAAFADVRTPDEAMERLQSLPIDKRLQVLALFQRVEDQTGG